MSLTTDYPSVYSLLKKYNIRAKKSLGQNFLVDDDHLTKIVEAADLAGADTVLEIGPGLGSLTALLVQKVKQVVAVEVDDRMIQILEAELGNTTGLTLQQADILSVDPGSLCAPEENQSYQVVANLPYYITSPIIQHLLEAQHPPRKIIITVQKEVAQRIVAKPGAMSVLAVAVQLYGHPTLCHTIPPHAFLPPPKVESAVLRIDRYDQSPFQVSNVKLFFRVVKAGFSQKRKQLKNSLSAGLAQPQDVVVAYLKQANIEPTRRAQNLTLDEWATLTQIVEQG
ncbi:MAG: 16S rRNA (adenine(1518)-N(6)/adenine(1519)-N(6))-dimethyltransferase RsmA [Chloroflexota bacterium]